MSENTPATGDIDNTSPTIDPNVVTELNRQLGLEDLNFGIVIPDFQLMEMLQSARKIILSDPSISDQDVFFPYHDTEIGTAKAVLSRRFILIFAQTCHAVRNHVADIWRKNKENCECPELFHAIHLPSSQALEPLLPSQGTEKVQERVSKLLTACLRLETEDIDHDILDGHDPDATLLEGNLHLGGQALDAETSIIEGVSDRLKRMYQTPPVHISRHIAEWRNWTSYIKNATLDDLPDIHGLYEGVMIRRDQLMQLDPRFASFDEYKNIAEYIRSRGAMFKALRSSGKNDEVKEGIDKGIIVIARDENSKEIPPLLGFYNVLTDADAVREHMKSELHFSHNSNYANSSDLSTFSRFEEQTGEIRTISYSYVDQALVAFRLAREGKLAWSVDHAVRMDGTDRMRRYAQLGTALKLGGYSPLPKGGKTHVLMKIATVIGVDASNVAEEKMLTVQDPDTAWNEIGIHNWTVDGSGMLILDRPILNVGSKVLNERLGAHEVMTVTEDFTRDGIRMRILWRYLLQPLPPELP